MAFNIKNTWEKLNEKFFSPVLCENCWEVFPGQEEIRFLVFCIMESRRNETIYHFQSSSANISLSFYYSDNTWKFSFIFFWGDQRISNIFTVEFLCKSLLIKFSVLYMEDTLENCFLLAAYEVIFIKSWGKLQTFSFNLVFLRNNMKL